MKWREILFVLTENKLTHLSTIANWNEINKELDKDIMNLQKLDLSPFKGFITEQISKWNILLISSVLEEQIKFKRIGYIYNEYLTVEIQSKIFLIPYEYKKFKMTDRIYQDLMNGLKTKNNLKK